MTRLAFAFSLVNGRAVIGLYYLRLPIAEATFKRVFLFSSVCLMDIFQCNLYFDTMYYNLLVHQFSILFFNRTEICSY